MTGLPVAVAAGLVHRSHIADGCVSHVWYSPCDRYRYALSRTWGTDQPALLFVMLNPSTADEHRNDPTVARCETRARSMGFGGVMIANLFAFRATRPDDLKRADHPVGSANDGILEHWSASAGMTIAAWGVHGGHESRAYDVASRLRGQVHHLGLTKDGHPRHPLYVSFKTQPMCWPHSERYVLRQSV
ncbi:DUF1643 domain-containing protein [Marivita sp.]|jgi:hypothetical protein|uniref:DUF1643 domain-containing protein n=1 Tax=Marivita sp. TaxID=2003365 RepID=UPI003F6B03C4